jgi:hypothetical protein
LVNSEVGQSKKNTNEDSLIMDADVVTPVENVVTPVEKDEPVKAKENIDAKELPQVAIAESVISPKIDTTNTDDAQKIKYQTELQSIKDTMDKELKAIRESVAKQANAAANVNYLKDLLGKSTASPLIKDRVLNYATPNADKLSTVEFKESVDKTLINEVNYARQLAGNGNSRIDLVLDNVDKLNRSIVDFFNPKEPTTSFKDLLRGFGVNVDGNSVRFAESVNNSTFPVALGDAMDKVVRDIIESRDTDWRKLVSIVYKKDFHAGKRVFMGNYPEIAERDANGRILQVETPPEVVFDTIGMKEYGGFEYIARRAAYNDESGFIKNMPMRMVAAAMSTLEKAVYNAFTDPTAQVGGSLLFSVARRNLFSGNLTSSTLIDAIKSMYVQKLTDTGNPLRLNIQSLVVPVEYMNVVYDLQQRAGNLDPTFANSTSAKLNMIISPQLTDAGDWYYFADPSMMPVIEVAFLDGQESPQLTVVTSPNGESFYDDAMRIKVAFDFSVYRVGFAGAGKFNGS